MYSRDKKNLSRISQMQGVGSGKNEDFSSLKQKYFAKIHQRNGPDNRGIRSSRRVYAGSESNHSISEGTYWNSYMKEDLARKNFFDSKISNLDLSDLPATN